MRFSTNKQNTINEGRISDNRKTELIFTAQVASLETTRRWSQQQNIITMLLLLLLDCYYLNKYLSIRL